VIAPDGFGSPTIFVVGDDLNLGNARLVLVRFAVLVLHAVLPRRPAAGLPSSLPQP